MRDLPGELKASYKDSHFSQGSSEDTDRVTGQPHTYATLTYLGPMVGYKVRPKLRIHGTYFAFVDCKSLYGTDTIYFKGWGKKVGINYKLFDKFTTSLEYYYVNYPSADRAGGSGSGSGSGRVSQWLYGMQEAFMVVVGYSFNF